METLQTLSRNDQTGSEWYARPDVDDGLAVSEEEYWEKYYNHPGERLYEWNDGHLEVIPMADVKGGRTHRWFCEILDCYLTTNPVGTVLSHEIGFRVVLPRKTGARIPDISVVLNRNPAAIHDDDCRYSGTFDLCIESLSHSSKKEIIRDTVTKKGEYEGMGVTEYYILDARKIETVFYRLNAAGRYEKIRPAGGIVRSEVLPGFQFRISDLYCQPSLEEMAGDPVYHDYVLPSFREVRQRAEQAEREMLSEKQRAEQAEREMLSEKQRAEQEKQRAEQEKQRAEQERQRAEQERQRAEQSENRFIQAAHAMLSNGLDLAAVMRYTGLSADEIGSRKSE